MSAPPELEDGAGSNQVAFSHGAINQFDEHSSCMNFQVLLGFRVERLRIKMLRNNHSRSLAIGHWGGGSGFTLFFGSGKGTTLLIFCCYNRIQDTV